MITVREIRTEDDIIALVHLGGLHRSEAAPNLSFNPEVVAFHGRATTSDTMRINRNVWISWDGDVPTGYAVGYNMPFFYNNDFSAVLNLLFVAPQFRKGWSAARLIRAFEEWATINGAVRLSVGVERTEKDEAKRIRNMFPKIGYEWAGSFYLKELTR